MADDAKRKEDDRQARLTEALRANLRKRKAQARARRKNDQQSADHRADQG
jgi:hypothetical protein